MIEIGVLGSSGTGRRDRRRLLIGTPLTVEQPPAETVVEMEPSTTMGELGTGC